MFPTYKTIYNNILGLSLLTLLTACGGGGNETLPNKDTASPIITSKVPENKGSDVNIFQPIVITFSKDISSVTKANIVLLKYQAFNPNNFGDNAIITNERVIIDSVRVSGNKLTINPNTDNSYSDETRYKITLIGIRDTSEILLKEVSWEFATTTVPTAIIQPTENEIVSRSANITVSFSEEMDLTSLADGLKLEELNPVTNTAITTVTGLDMTYEPTTNTAVYKLPSILLKPSTKYQATLLAQIVDKNGISLAKNIDHSSIFTTNTVTDSTQLLTQVSNIKMIAGNNSIDISWDAAPTLPDISQEISYNIYISNDDKIFTSITKGVLTLSYSVTNNISNGQSYRFAITANVSGKESLKVFSDLISPQQILSIPTIVSFTGEIVGVLNNSVAAKNLTITEGQSVLLAASFKNGTGTLTYNENNKRVILNAGDAKIDEKPYNTSVSPRSTTTYTFEVQLPNKPSAIQTVIVTVLKPEQISFKLTDSKVSETDGGAILTVIRSSSIKPMTIDYRTTTGGTATGGKDINADIDYIETSGQLNFLVGVTQLDIIVKVKNDNLPNNLPAKTFIVELSNPTGGASLIASNSIHTVTIIDNDILTLSFDIKKLKLSWTEYFGANNYKLWSIVTGSGAQEVDITIPTITTTNPDGTTTYSKTLDIAVHDFDWLNTSYYVAACEVDCTNSNIVVTIDQSINAIGYLKPKNIATKGFFGFSVSMSDDGNTFAVGTIFENSRSTGINSTPVYDLNYSGSGSVHVFTRSDVGIWAEQAYIKSSNSDMRDYFGASLALSSNGNLLAVGASGESSNSKVVSTNTNLSNELAISSGAVYLYSRLDGVWTEKYFIKAENSGAGDSFGSSVSISSDGSTLAVGAPREANKFSGVNVPISWIENNEFENSGAVYIFTKPTGTWKQTAYIKAYNTDINDFFGNSVALSSDGYTLAVGAPGEDSSTKGIWVEESSLQFIDNLGTDSGAVYMFNRNSAGTWAQQAYIKPTVARSKSFGDTVVLNKDESLVNDGNTLAVSLRNIAFTGDVSAAIVFNRVGTVWSEQALIKRSNRGTVMDGDRFGYSLALDSTGDLLVVGAPSESSDTPGINGVPNINAIGSGAVYTFTRTLKKWTQKTYIKAIKPNVSDEFGISVSISGDGKALVVGARNEKNSEGAIYLY